jgi:hypothetical protein
MIGIVSGFYDQEIIQMSTYTFIDFMQTLKPWLNDDYIHTARFDDRGNFTLMFVDGGQKVYQVAN